MNRPLILTRPEVESRRIAECLSNFESWIWPTYTFRECREAEAVRARLAMLDDDDFVLFVSPTAVRFVRLYVAHWPEHITLACAGSATAAALRCAWPEATRLFFPKGGVEHSGSESLLAMMLEHGLPKSLLILRAQSGREWLAEELLGRGVRVERLCVYEREPFMLSPTDRERLVRALEGPAPLLYLTSTDAVGVFREALKSVPGAFAWLTKGTVLTIHPRCLEAIRAAGFVDVHLTDSAPEAVIEAIRTASNV